MPKKSQRNKLAKPANARPLPAEEFARLVEGSSLDDIEASCAQHGAAPGGVPPAWDDCASWTFEPRHGAVHEQMNVRSFDARTRSALEEPRADFVQRSPERVVVQGDQLRALGIRHGDEFEVDMEAEATEGDLVIMERAGFGRLLRRLRFVGGAGLLCSDNPDRPAIPLEEGELYQVRVLVRASRRE